MILKKILKKIRTKKLLLKYKKYKEIDIQNIELPITSNLDISFKSSVRLKNITLSDNVNLRIRDNAKLEIGNETYFNNGCILTCRKHIKIGARCSFGPNVMMFDNDHNIYAEDYRNDYVCDDIIIGDDVWIGANVIILKGAKIGNHSVIGAGSIVKQEVPENSIFYNERVNKIKIIKKEADK